VVSPEWHPDDERLLGRYLDAATADDSLERHLCACVSCSTRYRSLETTLDKMHENAASASDAEFGASRLANQRRAILARLGLRNHGKLLSFPEPSRRAAPRRARFAVAAALVLMTTTGLLRVLTERSSRPAGLDSAQIAATLIPADVTGPTAAEEAVYLDIEMALARHGTPELRALDDLTPRALDESTAAR
jgi:hypothetical protein